VELKLSCGVKEEEEVVVMVRMSRNKIVEGDIDTFMFSKT
jgi:hypothetical protein